MVVPAVPQRIERRWGLTSGPCFIGAAGTDAAAARVLSYAWQRGSAAMTDASPATSFASALERPVAAGEPLAVSLHEELH